MKFPLPHYWKAIARLVVVRVPLEHYIEGQSLYQVVV